jgi:hydrophobic/amphiphilic exporter-1 (mainly G- bacteria), HAE1 family
VSTIRDLQAKAFDKINPAVSFSVTRYVMAIGFFVAVVVFGLVSALHLGVDLLPSVNIPVVVVNTTFPGASPAVVEEQISQVIENAVSSISNITTLVSTSVLGASRVVISFDPSTDPSADTNQVASLVSAVTRNLPAGVTAPSVQTFDPSSAPIFQFGMYAAGASLEEVGSYVLNDLTPLLERVNGVANIQLDGAPTRQYQVLLHANQLQYFGLNPQQVTGAIAGSAINRTIGTVSSSAQSITFSTKNQPQDVAHIASIIVDPARGIRVGQVAWVRQVPVSSTYARVNSQPVVLVSVQKTTDSNAVAVVGNIRGLLRATPLPQGYSVLESNDTTGPITASVNSTYRELILTAIVVAVICLLFLGKLDTALSVILAIPIALSAAPVLYNLAGFTFNLVSLLALIVAIGVVVDDSIVVAENVERYRSMGYSNRDSVLKGASEVFSAVVAASLSLLAVLLPVSFLGGFVGRYIMQFSLGLAAAVFFSLFEAVLFLTVRLAFSPDTKTLDWEDLGKNVTRIGQSFQWGFRTVRKAPGVLLGLATAILLLALHLYWWLPALVALPVALSLAYYVGRIALNLLQAVTMSAHSVAEAGLMWVRDRYANGLEGVLKRGTWVLFAAGAFFAGTLVLIGPRIPFSFVPQSDASTLQVNLRLPPGTPTSLTNTGAGRLEAWLLQRPEVMTVQATVGSNGSTFGSNPSVSGLTVRLVPPGRRKSVFLLAADYRKQLLALVGDLPSPHLSVSAGGGFRGQGSTVSFTLATSDYKVLSDTNQKMLAYLQSHPLVADVSSDLSDSTVEEDFLPDPSRLSGTGITPDQLAAALQTYTSGTEASTVQSGGLSYPIVVQIEPTSLAGQSLRSMPVYSSTLQNAIQASQLGDFTLSQTPLRLDRTDRRYSTTLDINLKPGGPTALTFQNLITAEMTKAGILGRNISFGAEKHFGPADLAGQLAYQAPIAFLVALFLAYLVMGAQFNSWRYPVYLLLPVPLALAGALWLVWAMGGGLDIFGLLGMLMLIGLSAKNSILYLDFVVERLDRMPFKAALVEAARLRFRPIIMTTLTVLVISFPLIFGNGQGAEFGQKLGVVMFGGIVSSTILTFFVVPAAFFLFERSRHPDTGPSARAP